MDPLKKKQNDCKLSPYTHVKKNIGRTRRHGGDEKLLAYSTQCKKQSVQKLLVRNSERPPCPVTRTQRSVLTVAVESDVEEKTDNQKPYKSPYAEPELLTTLRVAKEIKQTKAAMQRVKRNVKTSTTSNQIVEEKVLKRVNFPFEEKLYKNLVSLKLGEEALEWQKHGSRKLLELRPSDVEPNLSDFFTPTFQTEYGSASESVVELTKSVTQYDGHSIYNKIQLWAEPGSES